MDYTLYDHDPNKRIEDGEFQQILFPMSSEEPTTAVQPPRLYAELLPNLHHMNIHVALPSEHNKTTKVELLEDRSTLRVTHHGYTACIDLPAKIKEGPTFAIPEKKTRQLDWRLSDCHRNINVSEDAQNGVPWLADSLTANTLIACKSCKSALTGDAVRAWKALPSENWAEMMEFWHCHKPVDHNSTSDLDSAISTRGYSASNKPRVSPGIGLVGVSHVVLSEEDCSNIKASLSYTPIYLVS